MTRPFMGRWHLCIKLSTGKEALDRKARCPSKAIWVLTSVQKRLVGGRKSYLVDRSELLRKVRHGFEGKAQIRNGSRYAKLLVDEGLAELGRPLESGAHRCVEPSYVKRVRCW